MDAGPRIAVDSPPRSASALFGRLATAGALAYCSYAMCRSPVLPLFARHLGAAPELVGFVVGASTLTGVALKLPAGAISDVLGRRTMLLLGGGVFALLPFTYLPVATLGALVALRFVHGSATAIFGPVASATLSDLAPPARRGAWLGTYSAAQGVGQAAGPVLAGYLIVAGDFDRAFLASGIIGVGALALLAGWPPSAGPPPAGGWWRRTVEGVRDVAADRRILMTSVAQAGQFFLNGTIHAFLPLYASEQVALNSWQIGVVFGVQTVTTLAARPLFGVLSDRLGRRPLIVAGLTTCGAAVAAVSIATGFLSLLSAAAAYGAGLAVTTSATSAHITDLARHARYGAAHGVFGTIYDIGDAFGPITAGFLVAALGYQAMFRLVAGAVVLLAALFFWHGRTSANGTL